MENTRTWGELVPRSGFVSLINLMDQSVPFWCLICDLGAAELRGDPSNTVFRGVLPCCSSVLFGEFSSYSSSSRGIANGKAASIISWNWSVIFFSGGNLDSFG